MRTRNSKRTVESVYEDESSDSSDDESFVLPEPDDRKNETMKPLVEGCEGELKIVSKVVEDTLPNICEILKSKIHLKDKAKILELFEVYIMAEPYTEARVDLKNKINSMVKRGDRERAALDEISKASMHKMTSMRKKLKISALSYKYSILSLNTTIENISAIYRKYREYKDIEDTTDEKAKLERWIKSAIELPFDNVKESKHGCKLSSFLKRVSTLMDETIFGMKHVKEQILVFLNSRLLMPNMKGCSLALVGPPGVGKTTLSRSLAHFLDWPFAQISFGGMKDSEFLRGYDLAYVGSHPGEVSRCMSSLKHKNGIIFFDEYDKVSDSESMTSTLLHITDPEQNSEFKDNYFSDIKIDLSCIWFIYSMNKIPEDAALRDRLYTIEVPGYNTSEKVKILTDFVVPKILANIGLKPGDILIDETVATMIVNRYSPDNEGVRGIESVMKETINKVRFLVSNGGDMEGFSNISFNYPKILTYPVTINEDLFDSLKLRKKDKDVSLSFMYT